MDEPSSKRQKLSETIVNDIVHGIIKLPYYIQEIIDTSQFQRLRNISQLGFTSHVYPSASYSRFEHSIGTFYLASTLIKQIQFQLANEINKEEICITDEEIKCVEIAALCHDLGHGPFSHFWEHAFDSSLNIKSRSHEDLSVEIFMDLINSTKSNHVKPIKDEIKLSGRMIDLIGRIISGNSNEEIDSNKSFLFEIVANKKSGIDVDKFDYLCRDSIYLGWSNKCKILDIKRSIHFFRAIKDDRTNTWHLAMRDREIFNVHDVFYYRHLIHRYGVRHKTVKAVEIMFRKALKVIIKNSHHRDELIKSVIGRKIEYNSKIWYSKEFISQVSDYHIWEALRIHTNRIYKDIHERNIYKLFTKIHIESRTDNSERIKQKDIEDLESFLNKKVKNLNIKLILSTFALQSESRIDPLLSVKFYKKNEPTKCFEFNEETLPDLLKLKNEETVLLIFTDKLIDEQNSKYLDVVKGKLCWNSYQDNDFIHELRLKYNFKELSY